MSLAMSNSRESRSGLDHLADLARQAAAENSSARSGLPPVERWTPARRGEIDIVIRADGTWVHEGGEIARPALVQLFARILRREADGRYWLVTPAEAFLITVEDAPFQAVRVARSGTGETQMLRFETNAGDAITADANHRLRVAPGDTPGTVRPFLHVRNGLEARLARPVYYELAELAEPGPDGAAGVWSAGVFFPLEP